MLRRVRAGRLLLDGAKLRLPLFGNLVRMGVLARFARTATFIGIIGYSMVV